MAPAGRSNSNRRAPKTEEVPQHAEQTCGVEPSALVTAKEGITQKVKVYAMEMKGQVMQIVGSIGDRIVIIKAKSIEFGTETQDKVTQLVGAVQAKSAGYMKAAGRTVKAKTVFLQNGYVYMATKVEGQVIYAKSKLVEPVKSCALSLHSSSKNRVDSLLQKLLPHYTRVQGGFANVIGAVNGRIVVIRAKVCEGCAYVQMLTLQSMAGARDAIDGYTSPLLSKAVNLQQNATSRIECVMVSIKGGALRMKCMLGDRVLQFQTKISDTAIFRRVMEGVHGAKDAILDITWELVQMVTNARHKGLNTLKVIQATVKDNFLYITCQGKHRLVVLRLKVTEIVEYMQSRSLELYGATCARVAHVCSSTKTRIVNATEITRTKALEATNNIHSFAANPDARAGAAGAVALGASGGVTGFFAGAAVGAVCALPAAFFTFGLSIPLGAAVGASAGGAMGSSAGFVAGGVAGYKAHSEKDAIGKSIGGAFAKVKAHKEQAMDSASNLRSHLAQRINGHTGGTATD